MAYLLLDEDFDFDCMPLLRNLGHDVITLNDVGLANARTADSVVLSTAIRLNRAVVTFNRRDFIRLHKDDSQHQGIIVCTRDRDIAALVGRIQAAIASLPSLRARLIRIYRVSS